MISVHTNFEKINFKGIVAELIHVMAENLDDFAESQSRFHEAITWLDKEIEKGGAPTLTDAVDAIDQQIGSSLLFSCFLGAKANLEYFMDPVGHAFLNVDSSIYLREEVAMRLPDYQNAQHLLDRFFDSLSPAQKERYEDITTYISYLETVGPKLAHYYGYVLGNQVFAHVVPGYVADLQYTLQYKHMLEDYLGVRIS